MFLSRHDVLTSFTNSQKISGTMVSVHCGDVTCVTVLKPQSARPSASESKQASEQTSNELFSERLFDTFPGNTGNAEMVSIALSNF